jgi:hypothetical protein
MGVVTQALKELIAARVTGDALVAAIGRIEDALEPKRSKAAERMTRYRERQKTASRVTHDDQPPERNSDVTRNDGFPDKKEIPHTPLEKTNPSPSLRSAKKTRARATRIPENFQPDLAEAEHLGLSPADADSEAANFVDYWRSKPSNATKLDWPATWRNWCRKAAKDGAGRVQNRGPPGRQRSVNGYAAYALELAEETYEPAASPRRKPDPDDRPGSGPDHPRPGVRDAGRSEQAGGTYALPFDTGTPEDSGTDRSSGSGSGNS